MGTYNRGTDSNLLGNGFISFNQDFEFSGDSLSRNQVQQLGDPYGGPFYLVENLMALDPLNFPQPTLFSFRSQDMAWPLFPLSHNSFQAQA